MIIPIGVGLPSEAMILIIGVMIAFPLIVIGSVIFLDELMDGKFESGALVGALIGTAVLITAFVLSERSFQKRIQDDKIR